MKYDYSGQVYTIEIRGADEHSQKSMSEVYGVGIK